MGGAAQQAKDQGNVAFRAQKYAEAVGHYSAAIAVDSTDPTLPLNRAFAYLKLGKYLDAERDCTAVLGLSPRHVKALYRRAQARAELNKLDEAKDDLSTAVRLEPKNEAVQAELRKIEQACSSTSNHVVSTNLSKPAPVRRRRVPIEIVESNGVSPKPASQDTSSQPSQTEVASAQPQLKEISSPTPLDQMTSGAHHHDESPKPVLRQSGASAQGGMFRSSGESKIFRVPEPLPPQHVDTVNSTSGIIAGASSPPISLLDFVRSWELASASGRWDILCKVPPQTLPTLFKTSLDPSLLGQILEICHDVISTTPGDALKMRIREYLRYLAQVPRFATISLFLSKREKETGRRLGEMVGDDAWRML